MTIPKVEGIPEGINNPGFTTPSAKKLVDERQKQEQLQIDLDKYIEFVDMVTSDPSKDFGALINRYAELNKQGCKIERLDTAASGLVAESGEFMELVKKIKFQGKPWNDDVKDHLTTELGDILWYAAQACIALDLRFEDVFFRNTMKLASRYPEGEFTVTRSEERAAGDR